MKINLIFNEYGLVFNNYNTYQVEGNPKLNVLLARLKSRYSYLDSLPTKDAAELRAILATLEA
jgi:hypothetical protein